MFEIRQGPDGISILSDGQEIICNLRPSISSETTAYMFAKPASVSEAAYPDDPAYQRRYTFNFTSEDGGLSFDLHFLTGSEVLSVSINTAFQVGPFEPPATFKPVGGIKLLARLPSDAEGIMGCAQLGTGWWTQPFFSGGLDGLDRVVSLLWKRCGLYSFLLPVCNDILRTEIQGRNGTVEIMSSTYCGGYTGCSGPIFSLSAGKDPFRLAEITAEAALASIGGKMPAREDRRFPEVLEYLGWCTWDAFYREVDHGSILQKMEEFREKQVPVRWVMIDDGWSETKDDRLVSFDSDRNKFPFGLEGTISALKDRYGIRWVGVWQNLMGYWSGIHPGAALALEQRENLMATHGGRIIPKPDAARGFAFWNAWHSSLRAKGVDFVKVDNQSSLLPYLKDNMAIGTAAKEMHTGLEASVGLNFDGSMINCMGMAPEQVWHRPASGVARNSDDFYPDKKGSFREHLLQNAYNSFYHGCIMWGDWDMWWTEHGQDVSHSVLRAVSGGPVYTSDPAGRTDPSRLQPLAFSDGRIIRCDRNGLPTLDCLIPDGDFRDNAIKLWNLYKGTGVLAAFNISEAEKETAVSVSPSDIPLLEGDTFVVYEYFGQVARVMHKADRMDTLVETDRPKIYSMVPIDHIHTVLGLLDKYIPAAAIEEIFKEGRTTWVVLREGGSFGFACSSKPKEIKINGLSSSFTFDGSICRTECSGIEQKVLIEIVS